MHWLKEGDDNTALFHASLRARRSVNRICSIENMAGDWVDEPNHVNDAFLQFYMNLLGYKMIERKSVNEKVDLVKHYGRKGTRPNYMIKLDLRKVYDTVEWDFIEEILKALNFPQKFIQ
uniref:Reverse transcriptase n=1 Tax=Cannabis sativa TaxID=3483 RepID=A0A803PLG4_CANSA